MKITIDTREMIKKSETRISQLQKQIDEEKTKILCFRDLENNGEPAESERKRFDWTPIYKIIREFLSGNNFPVTTSELERMIIKKNIETPSNIEKSFVEALGVRLSAHPDFISHGRRGWTLKKEEEAGTSSSQ